MTARRGAIALLIGYAATIAGCASPAREGTTSAIPASAINRPLRRAARPVVPRAGRAGRGGPGPSGAVIEISPSGGGGRPAALGDQRWRPEPEDPTE